VPIQNNAPTPVRVRALAVLLPLALAALPQASPAADVQSGVDDSNRTLYDEHSGLLRYARNMFISAKANDGHCEERSDEAIQTKHNNNYDTIINNDDNIITISDDNFEITVKHRVTAALSPSSRIIKASEFQGKFADLPSVLESVSGVDIRAMGGYGQYAESSIRGGTAKGLRVYLDGVPLNTASSGAVDLSKLPLDKITEIRVTKGTSNLRQMGGGMGGVIELFTTDKEANRDITSINVEAGSFGLIKGGAVIRRGGAKKVNRQGDKSTLSSPKINSISHQINVDVSKSDNDYPFVHDNGTTIPTLRDPDPTWDDTLMRKSNNYYKSFDAAYTLSANIFDNHKVTQQVSVGAYDQGLFAYHYKDKQSGTTNGNTVLYAVDYQGDVTDNITVGGAASGTYRNAAISDPDGHFGLGGAKNIESNGATVDFLIDARYSFSDNFFIAGLTGARYDGYAQESKERSEKPEMSRYEYRIGTEAVIKTTIGKITTTKTALRAVYRYEIDTSSAAFNQWSSVINNYRLGYPIAEAVFQIGINPITIQLSATASKRSPTFFERFGWSGGFISNPDLREETRVEADVGISIDMGDYGASASVFAGKVGDKIKSIPYGNSFVKVMNFADTKFYGLELDINTKPLKIFTVELSAAYLKSIIDNAKDHSWIGRIEPYIPTLSGFLKTEVDVWNINAGHGIKYESDCYLSIENIVMRPRQVELSAWASYNINKKISLRYRVDNYLNTANFDFLDNPKPKRTHTVSAAFYY